MLTDVDPEFRAQVAKSLIREGSDNSIGDLTDVSVSDSSLRSEDLNSVSSKKSIDKNDNSSSTRSKHSIQAPKEKAVPPSLELKQPEQPYTIGQHIEVLLLDEDKKGAGYSADMTIHYTRDSEYFPFAVREYCQPIDFDILTKMYAGLQGGDGIPARTVAIHLRPDVRSDYVMEKLWKVLVADNGGCIMSQYGGYIRALIAAKDTAFTIEAQICTLTSGSLERTLLVRIFRVDDDDEAKYIKLKPSSSSTNKKVHPSLDHLRVATALIKLIDEKLQRPGATKSSVLEASFAGEEKIIDAEQASLFLATKFTAESSSAMTDLKMSDLKSWFTGKQKCYPSLSSIDWPVIVASGHVFQDIYGVLSKDCTFQSIRTMPANHTSAVDLLDLQYCSQLEHIAKNTVESTMKKQLKKFNSLKSKVEEVLESIAVFKEMTKHTCKEYGIIDVESTETFEQDLPVEKIVYLEDLVSQTMSRLGQNSSTDFLTSPEGIKLAALVVYEDIFNQRKKELSQKINDVSKDLESRVVEQEFHLKEAYRIIRDSAKTSEQASQNGNRFLQMVLKTKNRDEGPTKKLRTVPLFSFKTKEGVCYVSATHMVFDSKGGILSDPHKMLFALDDIEIKDPTNNSIEIFLDGKRKQIFKLMKENAGEIAKFLRVLQLLVVED